MFTFAYPGLLFLLLVLPFIGILYVGARIVRKKRLERLGNPEVLKDLMPEFSPYKSGVRLALSLICLTALIFALARPWGGIKNQETSREGIEIVIAVDASNSMLASASADENGPDRMKTAKLILERLINRLGNDKVGLIAYAGDAYTLIPVTNDYVSAKAFLNSIDPSLIPHQGTNIGAAVNMAQKSFSDQKDIGKAIILLTDADELENPEGVIAEVKQATKKGIQTDVIGIGSVPVTIPSPDRGRMVDDETGEIVRTALNEDLAIEVAKAGEGIYVNASNEDAIDELTKQLDKLEKSALESSFLVTHDELYYPFVILALVMLILDFMLTDKRNRWLDKINFFSKNTAILLLVLSFGLTASSCKKEEKTEHQTSEQKKEHRDSLLRVYSLPEEYNLISEGNVSYAAQDMDAAGKQYQEALNVNPLSVVAHLNKGLVDIQNLFAIEQAQGEGGLPDSIANPLLESAGRDFEAAALPKIEKENVSSKAFYNMGNIAFVQKNYKAAIDAYKDALRLNPEDESARRNLRIAQLQKNDDNQNQQNQQDQQDQQDQQQQQQQQQPDRTEINEQTSQQILDAAERKENMRRATMHTKNPESSEKSGRSSKRW